MSNTKKVHTRFWESMAQRFGKRWADEYGNEPTLAWRELIDRYKPTEIRGALDLMHAKGLQHPPTEPQFAELLSQAATRSRKAEESAPELRRGYWRSAIVHLVAQDLGFNTATFEPVLIENRLSLGNSMSMLLDEADDLEQRTGQRTHGIEDMVAKRCHEISFAFKSLKAAA